MFLSLSKTTKFLHFTKLGTDNVVFQLHSRVTVALLATFSLLLGSKQYFGDPIDCSVDGVRQSLMDKYCWITGTWTVRGDAYADPAEAAHPGLGAFDPLLHEKVVHAYYQWVPLVLAATALAFYVPRFVWKGLEGGLMQHMCDDMRYQYIDAAAIAEAGHNRWHPAHNRNRKEDERVVRLQAFYYTSRRANASYTWKFFACELLNMANVTAQWLLTDAFLDGAFSLYGHQLINYIEDRTGLAISLNDGNGDDSTMDPADASLPQGDRLHVQEARAQRQHQDARRHLRPPPQRAQREDLLHPLVLVRRPLLHHPGRDALQAGVHRDPSGPAVRINNAMRQSKLIIRRLFRCSWVIQGRLSLTDYRDVSVVCSRCSLGDWFILRQIGKNVNAHTFRRLVRELANDCKREDDAKELVGQMSRRSGEQERSQRWGIRRRRRRPFARLPAISTAI